VTDAGPESPNSTSIGAGWRPRLAALARRLDAEEPEGPSAVLEVVRYFNDEPDHPGDPDGRDDAAAPNLLGWHLDREVLDFLHITGAVLDVDEYDMTPEDAAAGASPVEGGGVVR